MPAPARSTSPSTEFNRTALRRRGSTFMAGSVHVAFCEALRESCEYPENPALHKTAHQWMIGAWTPHPAPLRAPGSQGTPSTPRADAHADAIDYASGGRPF